MISKSRKRLFNVYLAFNPRLTLEKTIIEFVYNNVTGIDISLFFRLRTQKAYRNLIFLSVFCSFTTLDIFTLNKINNYNVS